MKARVKATGEIITITGTDGICLTDENGYYYLIRDLEGCEAMFDYWEKLKHQYAGMVMQGMLGGSNHYNGLTPNQIASDSYKYANALVNRLKEESQHK